MASCIDNTPIIEQIAWNESSLLLKIQKQNTQTLQLFTDIIETTGSLRQSLPAWHFINFSNYFSVSNLLDRPSIQHFATLLDPVTEFINLESALHRQGTILVPKQVDPLSLLRKQLHPFYVERVVTQNRIQQC